MISKTKFKGLIIIANKSFKDKNIYFKEPVQRERNEEKFPFIVMSFKKKRDKRIASTKIYTRKYISVIKNLMLL